MSNKHILIVMINCHKNIDCGQR